MTQDAIVTRELSDTAAEVVVLRGTACGGNCGNCESCKFQNEIKAVCRNTVGAKKGQRVVIESSSRKIYAAALLVYIMPLLTFIAGYFLASLLGAGEKLCVLASFIGLAVGACILVVSQRRGKNRQSISFEIIRITDKPEET